MGQPSTDQARAQLRAWLEKRQRISSTGTEATPAGIGIYLALLPGVAQEGWPQEISGIPVRLETAERWVGFAWIALLYGWPLTAAHWLLAYTWITMLPVFAVGIAADIHAQARLRDLSLWP
jgi:hypothetical protein